jgi:DNA-binding NarL/FixJ family response regulator
MFTELIGAVFAEHDDLEIVAVATDGDEAVACAVAERPDVVVVDYQLPGSSDGLDVTARTLAMVPETRVLMLTGHDDDRLVRSAVAAGCAGFITKDRAAEELIAAVRAVGVGNTALGPEELSRLAEPEPNAGRAPTGPTPREVEVLGLLADGLSTQQMADRLFISLNTARNHVQRIIRKLGAHSRLEAVAIAHRAGVVRAHP